MQIWQWVKIIDVTGPNFISKVSWQQAAVEADVEYPLMGIASPWSLLNGDQCSKHSDQKHPSSPTSTHTDAKTADFEVLLWSTQKRTLRQFHMFTQRQISRCLERQVLLHNDRFQSILFTWGLNWNFIWAWIQYLGNISIIVLYNPVLTLCKIPLLISKQSVAFKVKC